MTSQTTKRLLIGEDDLDQQDVLVEVLAEEGYEITLASRPDEVLAALKERPDLAMLDLFGISTDEVKRAVAPGVRPCPLLLVSGAAELPAVARALDAEWLAKPYDVEQLLAALKRLEAKRDLANEVSLGI